MCTADLIEKVEVIFLEMAACLVVLLLVYLEHLWCRCLVRHMNRKKKGSEADVCDSPGSFTSPSLLWLVDCPPESL